jgi:RND family efflux transporter MFP subunit
MSDWRNRALGSMGLAICLTLGQAEAGEGGSEARGLVRSLGEAIISSEIAARIIAMPFREGQAFGQGDVLVAFDCDGIKASLSGARAELRAAAVGLESSRELARMKAAGQRDVELAEARRDRAQADVEGFEVREKSCVVRAPFAGAVVDRSANPHEVIAPSTPLMRIVDRDHLEIELIVSSALLAALPPGTSFAFRVDDTGRIYAAKIIRLGAVVEPASQTVKVFARFDGPHEGVLHGMSGAAVVPQGGLAK